MTEVTENQMLEVVEPSDAEWRALALFLVHKAGGSVTITQEDMAAAVAAHAPSASMLTLHGDGTNLLFNVVAAQPKRRIQLITH